MLCRCGKPAIEGYKRCQPCVEADRGYKNKYHKKLDQLGLCPRCGRERKVGSKFCEPCLSASQRRHREWRNSIYKQVLDHYGNRCVCCGETNLGFLTLDHKNNDGAKQRKEQGSRGGYLFYAKLIQDGFPDDLQLLCFNCNSGKWRFGHCPHTEAGNTAVQERYGNAQTPKED